MNVALLYKLLNIIECTNFNLKYLQSEYFKKRSIFRKLVFEYLKILYNTVFKLFDIINIIILNNILSV